MKNGPKMILLGTISLSCGIFIGFKACKALISAMVNDEEYMSSKIIPILENKIGKDKLERMARIYYDREDVNGYVFAKRSEAEEVLSQLSDLMEIYKVVSLSDFYDLIGETSSFKDNQVGWTDLKKAVIRRVYVGYLLELPPPQSIK